VGRRDPDVDLDAVQNIAANSKRVFVVCWMDAHSTNIQHNRNWLPRIMETINHYHPAVKKKIFRPESDEPIMLLIFE
jgi:alpha-L-fucosidase